MKIDNAAAAFRQAADNYSVERLPDVEGLRAYCVMEATGHELPSVQHGENMSRADADALKDQLAGRDGVTAVLREMISPIVLTAALDKAGYKLQWVEHNEYNQGRRPTLALLLAIIDVLNAEAS